MTDPPPDTAPNFEPDSDPNPAPDLVAPPGEEPSPSPAAPDGFPWWLAVLLLVVLLIAVGLFVRARSARDQPDIPIPTVAVTMLATATPPAASPAASPGEATAALTAPTSAPLPPPDTLIFPTAAGSATPAIALETLTPTTAAKPPPTIAILMLTPTAGPPTNTPTARAAKTATAQAKRTATAAARIEKTATARAAKTETATAKAAKTATARAAKTATASVAPSPALISATPPGAATVATAPPTATSPRPVPTAAAPPPPPVSSGPGVVGMFITPEDGRGPLIEEIHAAEHSITLQIYLLSDFNTMEALEAAQRRGVQVRVMLEEHPYGGGGDPKDIFNRLQAAGIDVRWSNPVFRFSHIKTMTIDGKVAIIMNMNLTPSAFASNREFNIVTTRPDDVQTALAIFEADWARTDFTDPGPLVVSPLNARSDLIALIGSAHQTLDVYAEAISDQEFIDALSAAAARGVTVRLIMSPGDARATATQARLAAAGVQVRLLKRPYIHAKIFLVDDQRAFVGSQNMTATSVDLNRELGIVIDDPGSITRIGRVFASDFSKGAELTTP